MLATTNFRLATKFAFISLFTVNIYDHILTFSDEVKYIWQRKITPGILILLSSSLLHVLTLLRSVTIIFFIVGIPDYRPLLQLIIGDIRIDT